MPAGVPFLIRLLIGAMCLVPPTAKAGNIELKQTPFGTGAEAGFGLLKYHNACVSFRVFFISGDFFRGLQEHKTPSGMEFRKKKEKTTYVNFPDQLLVVIEAHPLKCGAEITPPDYAAGLMAKPSLELSWKRGDEMRPVVVQTTEEHHHPLSFGWTYVLTVAAATVPLTDSLVIDVSLRQGICRTRLTANLDSRESNSAYTMCD
jgi:hypothetical protein